MPRYAVITMGLIDGVVTNLIIADATFVQNHLPKDQISVLLAQDSPVGIGWGYDEGVFIEPPPITYDPVEEDSSETPS